MNGQPVTLFATQVVMSRSAYQAIGRQLHRYENLVTDLRQRLLDQEALLHVALHELALSKEVEPQRFARLWLSANRQERGGEALGAG